MSCAGCQARAGAFPWSTPGEAGALPSSATSTPPSSGGVLSTGTGALLVLGGIGLAVLLLDSKLKKHGA